MMLCSCKAVKKIVFFGLIVYFASAGSVFGAQLTLQGRIPGKMDVYFVVRTPPSGGYDLTESFTGEIARTYHKSNKSYYLTVHSNNGGFLINPELDSGAEELWVEYLVTYGTKVIKERLSTDPKITYEGRNTNSQPGNENGYVMLPFTIHWAGGVQNYPAGSYTDTVYVNIITQ
jgi:hypothetical protein